MTRFRAVRDGAAVEVEPLEAGLIVDGVLLDWTDIDGVVEGDHRVSLSLANGSTIGLSALGTGHERCMNELRTARRRARMAALTVATGEPQHAYLARTSAGMVDVLLYAKVLVCEPRDGAPAAMPLSLIRSVDRDGYAITVNGRGLDALHISALGAKTDEFLDRLTQARHSLIGSTVKVYAEFDESLTGFGAADGWAVDASEAGSHWAALKARALAGSRAECVATLASLAGDALRVGIFTDGGTSPLSFVLAPVGGRVAVEATDGDDRATFVFATTDVERLNALLILTGFRREPLFLPDAELGRWAVAARTWPAVREMRAALVARVVHDDKWNERVAAALRG